jgi:SET domain-containing protein
MFNTLFIAKSKIHGFGLFASKYFHENDIIVPNCINNNTQKISYFGKYINHSLNPNTTLWYENNMYHVIAIKTINPYEEILADYNFTPYFINKPKPNW